MAQFNELKESIEDKQDLLSQDLQALLTEIRGCHQPHDGAINQGEDADETEEEAAARLAREQRRPREQAAAHARRPPPLGRGDGGRGADHEHGRGLGLEKSGTEEEDEEEEVEQPHNDGVVTEVIMGVIVDIC
jgi:hypothetical protein